MPEPAPPGRGEALVEVRAAALNPKDVLVRSGRFRLLSGRRFPKIMGLDLAGEVAATGRGVPGLRPGDRVFGFLDRFDAQRGTVAERVVVPARHLARMPAVAFEEAAAVPLAASTALQALRDVARARPGQRLAIHGASGGVGSFAVQVGKRLGLHVTAIGSADARAHLRALGADDVLDRAAGDPFAGDRVFDVVLDVFGSRSLAAVRAALAPRGVYVTTVPSLAVALDAARTLLRRPRARLVRVRPRRRDLARLAAWVEEGALRVPLDGAFDLADALEAVRRLETKHARGKIVIRIRGSEARPTR